MTHRTREELDAGLDAIRQAPTDDGVVELIVRRPGGGRREVLDSAELHPDVGLVGDSWRDRRPADPLAQLTIMGARTIALIAGERDQWAPAGDQLFLDLDLSSGNLPPGTRLAIGSAVVEITAEPHTGCGKFVKRFGVDAMKFVNSAIGRQLNLRGVNARVVTGGTIRVGDIARKITSREQMA